MNHITIAVFAFLCVISLAPQVRVEDMEVKQAYRGLTAPVCL
jgi:hypothetical protein